MNDLVITNGLIIDGSGTPAFIGSVGIHNGRITDVVAGKGCHLQAGRIIDADRCYVTPGWIDVHSHNDVIYFDESWKDHKIAQGITSEVVGNCGFSAAPFPGEGCDFSPIDHRTYRWSGMSDYFREIEVQGAVIPVSLFSLVGHGNIRASVMGFRPAVPTQPQLEAMSRIIADAMSAGAIGLSTGLAYPPGAYSATDELVTLAKTVARYDGIYVTHLRDEAANLLTAVEEAVDIARRAEIPLHISHLKAIGKPNHHLIESALTVLERAIREGLSISFDMYPYPATCTMLSIILPPWVAAGERDEMVERLGDATVRDRLKQEMGWIDPETGRRLVNGCAWEAVGISAVGKSRNQWMIGQNLLQIAQKLDKPPFDTTLDLLRDEGSQIYAVFHSLSEDNLWKVLSHPLGLVGSDGLISEGLPHPRGFGTFPRFIRIGVMDRKLISLEKAIEKLTIIPAKRFGLKRKGLIKPGWDGDITIFDLDCLSEGATFENPMLPPSGIQWVIARGTVRKSP
jgi:N-acyl-D-amino-acid deacylase